MDLSLKVSKALSWDMLRHFLRSYRKQKKDNSIPPSSSEKTFTILIRFSENPMKDLFFQKQHNNIKFVVLMESI